jgi:hypothetical protein
MRDLYKICVGKPEGNRPLGRRRHKWEDNIKIVLGEMGLEGVDCIHLAQFKEWWQALVNIIINLWVP